jgi:hypothetical protein
MRCPTSRALPTLCPGGPPGLALAAVTLLGASSGLGSEVLMLGLGVLFIPHPPR